MNDMQFLEDIPNYVSMKIAVVILNWNGQKTTRKVFTFGYCLF